ncbi:hypothetical protein [Nocardia arthritidis]|uniref:hypothetical protein n=1 Tax=Nocardia arthritidis TaxID=228602 RepID=UPI0009FD7EB7|nr:hypothetical protein [Nocardia arthritidis]
MIAPVFASGPGGVESLAAVSGDVPRPGFSAAGCPDSGAAVPCFDRAAASFDDDSPAGAVPGAELRVVPDGVWSRLITTVRASADWFGAEPGFDAPPVAGCFGAAVRSIAAVSASAPCAELEADAPVPERAGSPPSFAGAFARPGPAGPEGAVPSVRGALEVADPAAGGVFRLPDCAVGGCGGRWPAGVFARPGPAGPEGAVPGVPDEDGVFWLPWTGGREGRWAAGVFWPLDCAVGACAGRWPAGAFARPGPAGPEGPAVPLVPGAPEAAESAAGWVFWPLDCATGGCDGRWPAGDVAEAGAFGLPAPAGAAPGVLPAGLDAELGDGAFATAARPEEGVPSALAPPGSGAVDPAAGEFEGAGRAAELVRLSGVGGFAPADAPGCCVGPALVTGLPAGAEAPELLAEDGESVLAAGPLAGLPPGVFDAGAGPFAGFAPAVFDVAPVFLDEAGPLAGLAGACLGSPARGALGAGPRLPASAPDADRSVPDGEASGRCPLAMRSVGAADASGLRSAAAPGRASAPAAPAGSALSRAGFFSSFGSDTHTPRQSGTV